MSEDIATIGVKVDTTQLRRARDEFGRFVRAGENAGTRISNSARIMTRGIASVSGAVVGMAGAFAATFGAQAIISGIAEFDTAMSRAEAVTRATGAALEEMRRTATELGASTEFSAAQAADGLTFLGMAGFSAAESVAAIPQVLDLATAAGMGLAEAADTASNIMSAFGIAASNAANVTDVLAAASTRANTNVAQLGQAISTAGPIAATLGIALEDTAAAIGVMSDAGIQGERAGTALRGVLAALAGPTTQAQQALAAYGLTAADVDPATRSLADIMDTLRRSNLSTADAMEIFGREAASGALVMVQASDRLRDFGQELRDVDGAAQDMARTMRDNLGGDLRGLSSAISGLIIAMGDAGLTAILRGTVQAFTDMVRVVSENVEPAFNALLIVTSGLVATQLPALIAAVARLPALFIAAGGAVGVLNGALTMTAGLIAALGGPLTIGLALLGGLAAAAVIYRDRLAEIVSPADDVQRAQDALNQAMAVFSQSAAPDAAAAAVNAANAYREQAAAARDAAASELARIEAMMAAQNEMGMDPEAALFLGGQQSNALVALDRANAALTNATTQANLAIRQVTASTVEAMGGVADETRRVSVEIDSLGGDVEGLSADFTGLGASGSGAGRAIARELDATSDAARDLAQAMKPVESSFESAFVDFVTGAKSAQDAIGSLLRDLARLAAQAAFRSLFGRFFGGGGGFLGTIFGGARSFEGGGFTGSGPRSGGLDGRGGFLAMVHPNETVVDHTKGGGGGAAVTINIDARGAVEGVAMQIDAAIRRRVPEIIQAASGYSSDRLARGYGA